MDNPFRFLTRPHFFAGKLLTADDLREEQEYVITQRRRLNRFACGWGVLAGLDVKIEGGRTIVVSPGLAIDCVGNLLAVEAESRIPIPNVTGRQFVVLCYEEEMIDAIARGSDQEFSRIREVTSVRLVGADPAPDHRNLKPGMPGCGHAHALRLSVINRVSGRWHVVARLRSRNAAVG